MNTLATRLRWPYGMRFTLAALTSAMVFPFHLPAATETAPKREPAQWIQLFNGKNLSGWDSWLGPRSGGYHDRATSKEPALGLNVDPVGVFTVVRHDGSPSIRI